MGQGSSDLETVKTPGPPVPAWARMLDIFALLAMLIFASMVMFGGARFHVAFVRLSFTSAGRVLIVTLALLAIRHAIVRRDPIHQRIVAGARRWWRDEAVRAAAGPFVYTRLVVLFVGYLAVVIVGYPKPPPLRVSSNEWSNLPARWDAGWYMGIAATGYGWDPGVQGQQNVAFFPAYPALMRGVGALIGARPAIVLDVNEDPFRRRLLAAGLIISLVSFFWALTYLYRFARDELDDERARSALLLLASYPFAVFFSAAYTESLFLLATLAAFYHFRRDELASAGAWGLLAGLSRPNGFFLSVPLALLAVQRTWPVLAWPLSPRRPAGFAPPEPLAQRFDAAAARALAARLAAAALPGAGMLLYGAFLYQLTGNWFAWMKAQRAWGRNYDGLTAIVTDRYDFIVANGFHAYTASMPLDLFNGLGVVLALAMIWPIARRIGNAYALYVLLIVVPPMAAGGLLSMGRITSVAFPIFVALALLVPPRLVGPVACAFALLQGLAAMLFFTWRPLF